MQTSLSTIRMVAHNLKITAILKLPKLALCPLSPLRHSLQAGGGCVAFSSFMGDETVMKHYADFPGFPIRRVLDLMAGCRIGFPVSLDEIIFRGYQIN
jgi:hypothetical protein